MHWNEYKTKNGNKNTINKYKHFLESKFVGVNRLFVLVYSDQNDNAKRFKTRGYYLLKSVIDNVIIIENFYDQPIDFDVKRYKEIKKLATGQGKDYTNGCLLDYDYIKNHYRLIAADLSRQKGLDADSKAVQQMGFFGQLKNPDNATADNGSMFALTILERILKFSQGSVTVL